MEHQKTIKNKLILNGKGLHSGKNVTINLLPARANEGIKFCRIDLQNKPIIPASIDYVTDTSRGTTIEKDGVRVSTIEHLMASLYYFNIDNALIELDAPEVPILDGSAKIWVEKIKETGINQLSEEKKYQIINKEIIYKQDDKGIELRALPYNGFKVDIMIDYKSNVLGVQQMKIDSLESFETEIAPCRTFVFLHEIEELLQYNLIKGGDLDNALIFVEHSLQKEQIEHLAKLFNKDPNNIKVEKGVLNNIKTKFNDEPVRHKLLDFIGDLSLIGIGIKGHFIIKRPGHFANTEFVKLIKQK